MDNQNLKQKGTHLFIILFTVFSLFIVFSCRQNQDPTFDEKTFREEILTIYETKGEKELRRFIKESYIKIPHEFIVNLCRTDSGQVEEKRLKMAQLIAEEVSDRKALAKIFSIVGDNHKTLSKNPIPCFYAKYKSPDTYYEKALYLFKIIDDLTGQGEIHQKLGESSFLGSRYLRALHFFNKASSFYQKAGNVNGQGAIALKRGDLYAIYGYYSKAMKMYDNALNLFTKIKDHASVGTAYFKKGEVIFIEDKKNEEAFKLFQMAENSYKKVQNADANINGIIQLNLGKIQLYCKKPLEAIKIFDRVLSIFQEASSSYNHAIALQFKGDAYLEAKKYPQAIEYFKKALSYYKHRSFFNEKFYALFNQAKAQVTQGNTFEAVNLFDEAFSNLQQLEYWAPLFKMKKTLHMKVYDHYEEAISFMLGNRFYDKGFKGVEYIKTSLFRDRQTEVLGNLDELLSPTIKKQLSELATKFSKFSQKMHNTPGNNDKKKEEEYRRLNERLEELLVEIRMIYFGIDMTPEIKKERNAVIEAQAQLGQSLYNMSRKKDPKKLEESIQHSRRFEYTLQKELEKVHPVSYFYASRFKPLMNLNSLKRRAIAPKEMVISYFITSKKLFAFIISKQTVEIESIDITAEELAFQVDEYLEAISIGNHLKIKMYSKKLYKLLFQPIESKLNQNIDVVIIPDGELAKIPFESFTLERTETGEPVYLIEKYRVKYIQSGSLLDELRGPKFTVPKKVTQHFVGFGDPVYDYQNFNQGKPENGNPLDFQEKEDKIGEINRSRYALSGGTMNRLPASGMEVREIAQLFKEQGQQSVSHLRDQALEENAKASNIKQFGYIHFANHAILVEEFQSLLLSQDVPGKKEDGFFTPHEIMNCQYNANLVVLSTCQSGSGKVDRGESLSGLARAFMYAGVPAVVGSLWKVDDAATKELMISLYRNMLEKKMNKTEALRQAKLQLIKNEKYRSPIYWSAFIMYGE